MDYDQELLDGAKEARHQAYAPYSNFKVGAAIRTANGKIFYGANVENASYGLSICAERSAAVTAVTAGETRWSEIAVVAGTEKPTAPCGACRQFLAEFNPNLKIVIANPHEVHLVLSLKELLPFAFDAEIMESQNQPEK